ncbi:Laminin G domain protein [compost metagenome]
MRVCRGKSAYNGAFTPPTSLPAIVHETYTPEVQVDIVFQACMRRNALINEADLSGITLSGGALVQYGRLKTQPVNASRYSTKCAYFGAGEYTIECKVRLPVNPATSNSSVLGQWGNAFDAASSWLMWMNDARTVVFYWLDIDGSSRSITSSTPLPLNVDCHVVVEKVGTTLTLYFDGVSVATGAADKAIIDRAALRPLRSAWDNFTDTANTLSVTNIRIAKRAMYRGVIRPVPTFPKVVNADFIDFIKNGVPATWTDIVGPTTTAGQLRITPGTYLRVPSSESYILGPNNFTIDLEFSIQSSQASAGNSSRFTEFLFWSTFASPGQPINYEFMYDHVNNWFTLSAGSTSYRTIPFALVLGQTYKVQLTREGSILQLWVDGVKVGETAFAENFQYDVVTPLYIGRRIGGTAGDVFWNSDWTCKTLRLSKKARSQLTL